MSANRVVWGAAPVLAGPSNPGAGKGINDGIRFAAALSPDTGHATGVFLDASCDGTFGADPALVDTLNRLSVGAARPWTEDPHPACGSTVSVIGTAPEFADITSSDLAGWNCSVRVAFPTFETDFVPLAIGTDPPNPASTCGTDTTTQATNCGEAYLLAAGPELTAMDSEISVTPLTATNPVGATHTITATVKSANGGGPLVGQLVSFNVSGANAGATGTCVPVDCKSDSTGTVTFTYTGVNAGTDTITASFMCNHVIHTADRGEDMGRATADDRAAHDGRADDRSGHYGTADDGTADDRSADDGTADDRSADNDPSRRAAAEHLPGRTSEVHPAARRLQPVPGRHRGQLGRQSAREVSRHRDVHDARRRQEVPLPLASARGHPQARQEPQSGCAPELDGRGHDDRLQGGATTWMLS